MNTAAILPLEERCVCKCHGSESVCDAFTSILQFFFQLFLKMFHQPNEAEHVGLLLFFGSYVCLPSCQTAMEGCQVKGGERRSWNDVVEGRRSNQDQGVEGDVC